ncbi:hypothetical protein [Streptomyces luteireticuli]|uniref:hypothetical protein n=1 Tax=Streptomyces luteireticuli TaxID=173858 RepID=UPI0035565009
MIRIVTARRMRALSAELVDVDAAATGYLMDYLDCEKRYAEADRLAEANYNRASEALASADAHAELADELETEVGMLRESLTGALQAEKAAEAKAAGLETEVDALRIALNEALAKLAAIRPPGTRWFYVLCRGGQPLSIHETRDDAHAAVDHILGEPQTWSPLVSGEPLATDSWQTITVPLPPVAPAPATAAVETEEVQS